MFYLLKGDYKPEKVLSMIHSLATKWEMPKKHHGLSQKFCLLFTDNIVLPCYYIFIIFILLYYLMIYDDCSITSECCGRSRLHNYGYYQNYNHYFFYPQP